MLIFSSIGLFYDAKKKRKNDKTVKFQDVAGENVDMVKSSLLHSHLYQRHSRCQPHIFKIVSYFSNVDHE